MADGTYRLVKENSGGTFDEKTVLAVNGKVLGFDASLNPVMTDPATGGDLVNDTTPQLGGNLDVNGNKIVSASNGDIDIEPNGTGDVLLGNLKFDADQTVGSGQDNYVLTYDNSSGKIVLEAAQWESTGIISTTYAALKALADNSQLTPGQQYSFPFKTKHWLVDANGNYCNDLVDAPAPGNITITPDAVGANPVTWYYRVIFVDFTEGTTLRSQISDESTYQKGDSTTELVLNCDSIPSWATNIYVAIGTSQDTYSDDTVDNISTVPSDILPNLSGSSAYELIQEFTIKQVVDESETPTRSIVEGAEETLVVTATSTNTLAKIAFSVDYTGDYIEYNIGDASMQSYAQLYDTDHFIDDYRGTITRRGDTLGNILNWDIRAVKYRMWNVTQPDWASGTYNQGDTVMYTDSKIYGAKQEAVDIEPTVTANWEDYWEVVINTAIMGLYLSPAPDTVTMNGYTLTIQDAADFQDVLALGEGSMGNVHIGGITIFPGIVLPAYSRWNIFNNFILNPIFWQPVSGNTTVTHQITSASLGGINVRQFYIDDSDNSMVIGEGYIGMEVGG